MNTAATAATVLPPAFDKVEIIVSRLARAMEASVEIDERVTRLVAEPWEFTGEALARKRERLESGRRRAHERIAVLRRALRSVRTAA